ncbi:MAG: hypothetical protein ACRD0U_20735 [Acidimicrobiales bacterium]
MIGVPEDFFASGRLWLLVVVAGLAVVYVVLQARRRQDAVRFTNVALLDTVAPKRSSGSPASPEPQVREVTRSETTREEPPGCMVTP